VVKFYNESKGFGFLTPEGGGKDVFFHVTSLKAADIDDPIEGDRLRYDIETGRTGKPQASNLSPA
jgi:CspA family cold shock protein